MRLFHNKSLYISIITTHLRMREIRVSLDDMLTIYYWACFISQWILYNVDSLKSQIGKVMRYQHAFSLRKTYPAYD